MLSISDYGLIGNTRTAALVSREGSIDWCCLPRFDSDGVFSRILDEDGGHMQICPKGPFSSRQQYLSDTNVLETIFTTSTGEVRLLDCFPVDTEDRKKRTLSPFHEILRVVEGVYGEVEMTFAMEPRPRFGKKKVRMKDAGRFGTRYDFGTETLYLNHDLGIEGNTFLIMGGEKKIFSLSYNITGPGIIPPLGDHALIRLERTINYWREWIETCNYHGKYAQEVKRSALALKLLTYSPSGAIIAAPTTSLPEKIHGERNWDYRFCWLRDAAFTVRAFLGLGLQEEARAYMSWILHSTALTRPRLQVMYTLYGYSKIPEKILRWFSGFRGSQPVRTGNGASTQFQLDVYGEVMDAVYLFSPHVEKFDKDNFQFLKGIADSVCDLWQVPDEGIWEIRSGPLHHVHSQAMALIALDRFLKLADRRNWKIPREKYETTARQLKKRIENEGYSEALQSYVRATDDEAGIDASLLTIPILGEGLLDDRRIRRTVRAVQRELMENGLTYRYKNHKDGLPGTEGAFGACSFWMVEDLARIGQKQEARELMDTLLEKQNNVGLWPEELDPSTDEYLGNYPQAFTHTALIGAALTLEEKFS